MEFCSGTATKYHNWNTSKIFYNLQSFYYCVSILLPPAPTPKIKMAGSKGMAKCSQDCPQWQGKICAIKNYLFQVCMDNDYQSKGYLCYNYGHKVSIERISPYQESYTVNSHWKIYNDIISDVSACVRF